MNALNEDKKIKSPSSSRLFKIYISIMALLIVLILGCILGLMIYGGMKVAHESKALTTKVNSFNHQVNNINLNLNNINSQLKNDQHSVSSLTNLIP